MKKKKKKEELFYLSPIHLVRPPLSSSSDPDLALRRTEVRLQCEESFWEVISSSNQQVNSTNVVLIFPGKFSSSIGSAQSFGGKMVICSAFVWVLVLNKLSNI